MTPMTPNAGAPATFRQLQAEVEALRARLDACRTVVVKIIEAGYVDEGWNDWRLGDGSVAELIRALDIKTDEVGGLI